MKTLAKLIPLVTLFLGGTALAQAEPPGAEAPPPADPPASASRSGGFGHSGGFVSLGAGGTANIGGELENLTFDGNGLAWSLAVGQRFGMVGLEVGVSRYGIARMDTEAAWTNTALSAAGRFTLPIGPMWGAYVRAGIEKTWMTPDRERQLADYSGTGWLAGIGGEYRLRLGPVAGSVWAELTRHDSTFVNPDRSWDGHIDLFQLGVSAGF
jgi:hypothetical protein